MKRNRLNAALNKDEVFTLLALHQDGEGRYISRELVEILGPDLRRTTTYEYIPGDSSLMVETHDITIERRVIDDPAAEIVRLDRSPTVTAPTRPKPDPEPEPDKDRPDGPCGAYSPRVATTQEIVGGCVHGGPDDGCDSCAEAVRLDECKRI